MGRSAYKKESELLQYPVSTRVNRETYDRLNKLLADSNCQTIGEVARKILSREKILCLYKDHSMNGVMEELAGIRKELKAVGININQLTRGFHQSRSEKQQAFYVLRIVELEKQVGQKTERLLHIIHQLAEKWL